MLQTMKSIIIACLLLSAFMASCQVHWDQASDWTLYSYQGHRLFKIPVDSLSLYDHQPMNQDSMATFVKSAKILDTKAPLVWMGGYVATCNISGSLRKVELSIYGGYFYDEKTSQYYQLPPEKAEAWISFLQQSYMTSFKKKD
jgi:hypothetical protein